MNTSSSSVKHKKGLTCGKPVNSTQYDHLRGIANRHEHPHIPEPEVAMIFRKKGSRSSEVDLNDLEEKLLRLKKDVSVLLLRKCFLPELRYINYSKICLILLVLMTQSFFLNFPPSCHHHPTRPCYLQFLWDYQSILYFVCYWVTWICRCLLFIDEISFYFRLNNYKPNNIHMRTCMHVCTHTCTTVLFLLNNIICFPSLF